MCLNKKLKAKLADTELRYKTALAECINIMDPEQTRKVGETLLNMNVLENGDKEFVTNLIRQNQSPTSEELRIMRGAHLKGRIFKHKKRKGNA